MIWIDIAVVMALVFLVWGVALYRAYKQKKADSMTLRRNQDVVRFIWRR